MNSKRNTISDLFKALCIIIMNDIFLFKLKNRSLIFYLEVAASNLNRRKPDSDCISEYFMKNIS